MEENIFKEQLALRINEVLYYVWDPVGVNDLPSARDEYDSYAKRVLQAVLEGKSKDEISKILTKFTTGPMGLEPRKEHDDEVAEIVLEYADLLRDKS